jgi:endoglucanase
MLTLVAMHVLNDTSDPFFTRLQAGAFEAKKPSGNPCDAAFQCHPGGLSTGAKVALGVTLSIVGCAVIAAGTWYYTRRKGLRFTYKA